jgi:hypothetical protein
VSVNHDGIPLLAIAGIAVSERVVRDVPMTHVERIIQWDDMAKRRGKPFVSSDSLSAAEHAPV